MSDLELLRSADLEWTAHIEGIWSDPPHDVPELHRQVRRELELRLQQLAQRKGTDSPLGVPVVGEAGAGKTHLMAALRQAAFQRGGGFVVIDMTDVNDFWATAQLGFLRALYKPGSTGRHQFRELLQHLYEHHLGSASGLMDVDKLSKLRPPALINQINTLLRGLAETHRREAMEYQDVVRALALVSSDDFDIASVGDGWLQGLGIDDDQKFKHGFRNDQMAPAHLLRALAWLYSIRAPLVIALDQLDAIVAEHNLASGPLSEDPTVAGRQRASLAIIEGIANGLMGLRDMTRRALTVVSCLEATWNVLRDKALAAATDRFEPPLLLKKVESGDAARRLVANRLAAVHRAMAERPAYDTWPFASAAFRGVMLSPREILKRCDLHVRACLEAGKVSELTSFSSAPMPEPEPRPADPRMAELDARFAELVQAASIEGLKTEAHEGELDFMLENACAFLVEEQALPPTQDAEIDRDFERTGQFEPLHARIRLIHHDQNEREQHYSFRFLEHANPNAFQARLNRAITASGIDRAIDFRILRILRFEAPPGGKKTKELIDRFAAHGGRFVRPSDADLRALSALATLGGQAGYSGELKRWLRARRPTSNLALFAEAHRWLFPPVAVAPPVAAAPSPGLVAKQPEPQPSAEKAPVPPSKETPAAITVGSRLIANAPSPETVRIPIPQLAKHAVVLAGAGSGKTVLVRRIVEEAALAGVPSVVLDLANDLSLLGDPWPERPAAFNDEDQVKARAYFEEVDVRVWTPGRAAGNALRLDALPDLRPLLQDPDEYQVALDLARTSLEPLALGRGAAGKKGRLGLLTSALDYYARHGGHGLPGLIALLSELPPEAEGGYQKAAQHAREMGDALREQLQINPLLRTEGRPLDPAELFGDDLPAGTRVSIINFVGLPSLEAQQAFVNQLAMTLFSWIKAHPAKAGRPLRGLLIIDEAKDLVPSSRSAASGQSLVRLANQARKYGLGLVFATQQPKSIDHNVVANCATQFYGRAASPASIEVIQEQIKLRGGNAQDIAKLVTGQFYVYTEGMAAPVKISTRLSLSHHPRNPPDEAGVLERATRSRLPPS